MKTKDKIIYTALDLFNQQGERSVTTNHIAAKLDISPGNLYYHFRNKQAIIRAIFSLYSNELLERFSPPHQQKESLSLLKHYLDSIFTLMWKYRFFYSNLPDILRQDAELHADYIEVQEQLRFNLKQIIEAFIAMDFLRIEAVELPHFITTLHLITSSWLNYQSAQYPNAIISERVIYLGMLQIISVVKPKATEQGREQLELLEDGMKAIYG